MGGNLQLESWRRNAVYYLICSKNRSAEKKIRPDTDREVLYVHRFVNWGQRKKSQVSRGPQTLL